MSTSFRFTKGIRCCELFDGRLERYGIREETTSAGVANGRRCLSDGQYCIWVFGDGDGYVRSLKRYGYNVAANFLQAICDTCHTDFVSEHEARDWGLAKMEDWKAWLDKVDEEWRAEQSGTIKGCGSAGRWREHDR